jgi:hypothetical protein
MKDGARIKSRLDTVFPAAAKLFVSWPDLRNIGERAVCLLKHLLPTTPALVTKLLALRLSLGIVASSQAIAPAVAGFLSRYGGNTAATARS